MQLAARPFIPLNIYVPQLFVLGTEELKFEGVYVPAEENRLSDEVKNIARAADPSSSSTKPELVRKR